MDTAEKLDQSERMKEKGTAQFKAGQYEAALKFYNKIMAFLESEDELKGEEKIRRDALLLPGK
jgi:hypothetical protein